MSFEIQTTSYFDIKLAKPRKELSADADAIENFIPTISDL